MIRESKVTFKQVGRDFVDVHCQTRDDNGPWQAQGVIPLMGTVEQAMADWIANQERWGWTPYDIEEQDTVTFWKEL